MTAVDERISVPNQPDDSRGSPLGSLMFIVMALIVALTIAVLGAIAVASLVSQPAGSAAPTTSILNLTLTEFSIEGELTAPAGPVVLNISNEGSMDHNVFIQELGVRSQMLGAGGSATLDLGDMAPGEYTLICEVAGHEASGMVATLTITAGGAAGDAADATEMSGMDHGADGAATDAEAMDAAMIESMLAYPAETEGHGNQMLEPKILPDGTKQFELTAAITKWEKAPGEIVDAWSYNGQVPGPQIKVDLGDKVEVIVHNETPLGTDVHWHGVHTPNDQDGVTPYTQDPIKSGESYTYSFVADDPAIGMYHAHLHSQVSVPNGMFGAFVVGDNPVPAGRTIGGVTIPADLTLAADMPMILNDAGVIGLSLNGKSFPATEPIVLTEGDWVSVTYYNEGLTPHPMHLHQFPQLVYAKDGFPLDEPYWADTINIAPGERYTALFQATDPGTWVWHCHILNHVEREDGMFGMVTAIIVNPKS